MGLALDDEIFSVDSYKPNVPTLDGLKATQARHSLRGIRLRRPNFRR